MSVIANMLKDVDANPLLNEMTTKEFDIFFGNEYYFNKVGLANSEAEVKTVFKEFKLEQLITR